MATVVSTAGVSALLLAYVLQATGRLAQTTAYFALNLVGSMLAAVGSWMIGFVPFVVLEVVWAATAAQRLVSTRRRLQAVAAGAAVADNPTHRNPG